MISCPTTGRLCNMDGVLEEAVHFMTETFVNSTNSLAAFRTVFIDEAKRLVSSVVVWKKINLTDSMVSCYCHYLLSFTFSN